MVQCSKPFWLAMWTDGEAQKVFMKEIKENFALLEAQLKGKKFFGGETIGLVDIAACGCTRWLDVCEEITGVTLVTEEEFPRLHRWAVDYAADEKISACLPDRAVLLENFTAKKELFAAITKSMLPK
jgi:glutathione S-transferase